MAPPTLAEQSPQAEQPPLAGRSPHATSPPASVLHFSLVVATLGRTAELRRLLDSLTSQTYRHFELIVVDQNPDDRLVNLLEPYKTGCAIRHLRCRPGVSRARNVGLGASTGDLIAFPDDDCYYAPALLQQVVELFIAHPQWDGLAGRPLPGDYYHRRGGPITVGNVWKRGIEHTMFFRRGLVEKTGRMDETLGVGSGSNFWAGEGTDYILSAMALGCQLHYCPSIQVNHPGPIGAVQAPEARLRRAYYYALGKGRVLRKQACPLRHCLNQCLRPWGGALLSLLRRQPGEARVYAIAARGVWRGWRGRED